MKTTIKILLALVLSVGLFSCGGSERNPEFTSYTFVTFTASDYSVAEDTVEFSIPVQVYPKPNGDITVTLAVVDDPEATAKVGTDFTLEDDVLTFSAEDTVNTKAMTVKVVNHAGVFTNTLDFAVEIAEVVGDNVVVGTNNYVPVVIKDLDHPLSAILGNYTPAGYCFNSGKAYNFGGFVKTITFSTDPEDATKVWFSTLTALHEALGTKGGNPKVYGIVSEDMKTIKVPYGQITSADFGEGLIQQTLLETIYVSGVGIDFIDPEEGDCITFTRQEGDGIVFASHDSWDYWDVEDGSPAYYNFPVLGDKWAALFGLESLATTLTKN